MYIPEYFAPSLHSNCLVVLSFGLAVAAVDGKIKPVLCQSEYL